MLFPLTAERLKTNGSELEAKVFDTLYSQVITQMPVNYWPYYDNGIF